MRFYLALVIDVAADADESLIDPSSSNLLHLLPLFERHLNTKHQQSFRVDVLSTPNLQSYRIKPHGQLVSVS